MKKLIFLVFAALVLSVNAFAHQAFTLVSTEKKTIKEADLATLEKGQTIGKKDKSTLTFTQDEIRLVIITGPEDDMLSYVIQGMRNPTLVVPIDAKLKILFVNIDGDMKHDVRFGHIVGDFVIAPDLRGTAGAEKLAAKSEDGIMNGEEMVITADEDGIYKYFCSVRGHAKGGMWGNIAVGVKPGDLKTAPKTKHVHSADEDMEDMPGMKKDDKPPVKKPDEMSDMPGMKKADEKPDAMANMPGMKHAHGDGDGEMQMSSVTNIGDPMERESSGTSWAPDSSPMYAKTKMYEDGGMLMLMGTGFLRYKSVGSTRDVSASGKGGRSRVDAPSMFMAMFSKPIGAKAQIGFRGMFSLDPIIQRGYGYPLLYQSGEQFRGRPIHDRQHPHDLFSELAITYSYKFDEKKSFYLYAGYPGEPALGPPMYLHRTSGMNDPDAPIGHHWQDATHITFGVVTAGFSFGKAKIEASAFNGTEPNENRYNFDKPHLNSFSGRLSFNPTKNWSLQVSHGYLKNPEPLEPEIRILRKTTASAIYNKKIDDERNWASTFVWGQNHANGERTNSFLFESNYDFYKNAVFGRVETAQKNGHDLVLNPVDEDKIFRVNSFSLGYVRDIVQNKGVDVGLGSMFTINKNSSALTPYYGGTTHGGWQVFMRFRPSRSGH
ncbi:MAG: plastocyanin/azurin family copper-binding protein [Pyrinomonadaceae bacterium]